MTRHDASIRQLRRWMEVVILANAPEALTEVCGVPLLERQLRILQRLGFHHATIVSETPDEIRAAIEPPSWPRCGLMARLVPRNQMPSHGRTLFLPGNIYCDARLIQALTESERDCALIDSVPPNDILPLLQGLPKTGRGFLSGAAVTANYDVLGELDVLDAAQVPAYITGMRRTIRPVFFPAPPPNFRRAAERIVLDTGQNGTLDIPAILQSPVETWIMRWLCRTAITPNQLSIVNFVVGLAAAGLFATGHLWLGMVPALAVGVIDGLDGKQARVKIETTATGKWEHYLDLIYETSWWAALAFWFQRSGELSYAWVWFLVIMASEGLDRLAKHTARRRIHTLLDDYSPFDRLVRRIGARRDVYLWAFGIGLALGVPASTYRFCAIWGMITAGVHWLRAGMIVARSKVANAERQIATETR